MIQLLKNKDIYGTGLLLLLTVLIGYQEYVSPAIGIFAILLLLEGIFFRSLDFKWTPINLLFVALFLLYLAGLLWSDHRETGWKLLEYKMSFFIFPLFFLFTKKTTDPWLVLQGLIWGTLLLVVRIFYLHTFSMPDTSEYEIANSVLRIHPTYACIYLTTAVFFMIYGKVSAKIRINTYLLIALTLLFIYTIYQLGSFAGILFLGLTALVFAGWWIYRKWRWYGLAGILLIGPALFLVVILRMDRFAYDIEMTKAVYTEISQGKKYYFEKNREDNSGTKMRVLLWILSAELIAENPWGVGTGDIDYALMEKCETYNLVALKKKNLNPHNQFLQTGIDIGIPGMIILLFLVVGYLRKGIRTRNYLLIFLIASLTFNAMFESVLQKQSGIVFYSFVICFVTATFYSGNRDLKPLSGLNSTIAD